MNDRIKVKIKFRYRALHERLQAKPAGRLLCSMAYNIVNLCFPISKSLPTDQQADEILDNVLPDKGAPSILEIARPNVPAKYDVLIVMPVYNVEQYVAEAIESVLRQKTRYTYLLRIVNDGSTDSSRNIIDRYSGYPNIEIIDIPNGGPSSARNAGMQTLDADYLLFLDSDDYLEDDAIDVLVTKAKTTGAEVVQGSFRRFWNGETRYSIDLKDANDVEINDLKGMPLSALFSTRLFAGLCFPLNYWYEDVIFETLIFPRARKIATTSALILNYRYTPGSITRSGFVPKQLDSLYSGIMAYIDADNLGLISLKPEYYTEYLCYLIYITYVRTAWLGEQVSKAVFVKWRQLYESLPQLHGIRFEYGTNMLRALIDGDFSRYERACLEYRQ